MTGIAPPRHKPGNMRGDTALLIAGVVLVAFNLRPALASVAPLLPGIRVDLGLSGAEGGLLTTLPVLCFGALAMIAPRLGRRYGLGVTLLCAMALLVAGIALRSIPTPIALIAGTVVIGASIATGNVLVPAIVKRDLAHRTGLVMGLYAMALDGGAALAAGLTLPAATLLGASWNQALVWWTAPAIAALLLWLFMLRRRPVDEESGGTMRPTTVWRNPVAWFVSLFMGLQSLGFYALLAWLPTLVRARGVSADAAGWLLAAVNIVAIPTSLLAPVLAARSPSQRLLVLLTCLCYLLGLAGLFGPVPAAIAGSLLIGAAQGAALGLALTFVLLRTTTGPTAAALSGMSQCVGYSIAATGPIGLGAIQQATGGWTVPVFVLIGIVLVLATVGLGAARNDTVENGHTVRDH